MSETSEEGSNMHRVKWAHNCCGLSNSGLLSLGFDVDVAVVLSALVVGLRERVDSILKCVERGSTKKVEVCMRKCRRSNFGTACSSSSSHMPPLPFSPAVASKWWRLYLRVMIVPCDAEIIEACNA